MTKIEKTQQAIANLRTAIEDLVAGQATDDAVRPYRENLTTELKRLASFGVCPDCGGAVDIDPACVVSEPVVDPRTMELRRVARIAKAALCSGCEFCLEL